MSGPDGIHGNGNGRPGGSVPPQNLDAERSVLGAVLLSDTALPALIIDERLQPEDFYREAHRVVFQAMLDLHGDGRNVDELTLLEHLKQTGELERAGGRATVDLLAGSVPAVANHRQYARIVRENAMLRRLLGATYAIQEGVHRHEAPPRELVDLAERSILEVAHDDRRKDFRGIHDLLDAELEKLHELSREGKAITGTASGFEDLDRVTGGFQAGNLVILAARPSMGKCLAGSTLVYDPRSGRRHRLDDLVSAHERGEEIEVATLGQDLRLRSATVRAAARSGVQPTFRLTTRLGRRLDATANHPLLTLRGWSRIEELAPGDRVAVPRRLPEPGAHASGRLRQIRYSTIGRRLAVDVQHLLLRLGVEARVRHLRREVHEGTDTVAHEVLITGQDGILAFQRQVRIPGKIAALDRAAAELQHLRLKTNADTVPFSELAGATESAALEALAPSDLWWDEVASIEPLGPQETFDLEVPDGASFVADDILVHNSALMANFAENASLGDGKAVALFSLEMSESELAQRFIASQASIKGDDLRKGHVPETRWPKILAASERLAGSPLFVDDSSDLSVLDVRAKARRLAQQHADGLGLILIDYLQLMRASGGTDNRVEQIGQISRGLKTLARELDVPVVALSQLNRGVEQRTDKRPVLSDLRESGCLAGDSLVQLVSGERVPIRELVNHPEAQVWALDPSTWKLEPRLVVKAFSTGENLVFRLVLRSGRRIRATANHRFLTLAGWRRLDVLRPGTRLATPRRSTASSTQTMSNDELALLGHLIDWDEVIGIEPDGVEPVFDLTVEGLHNFVAEDIVVHNSIEQDADLVMFIYREEYYDRDSEREGIADLIVAKHRNGGLATIELTFQKEYPRFMSYVSEDRY